MPWTEPGFYSNAEHILFPDISRAVPAMNQKIPECPDSLGSQAGPFKSRGLPLYGSAQTCTYLQITAGTNTQYDNSKTFAPIPFSGAPIAMLSPVSWKGCSGSQAPAWLEASSQAQLTSQQPWAMPWKYFRLRCWHRPSASTCTRALSHEKHCIRHNSRIVCRPKFRRLMHLVLTRWGN